MTPRKGFRFLHSRVINWEDKTPALYEVTRVARGQVYYRPVYGVTADFGTGIVHSERLGSCECCSLEYWPKVHRP